MTIEEYTEKLQHGVLNADEMPAVVNEVIENLKTDLTTIKTLEAQAAADAETIQTLRETNMKLFLRQQDGGPDPEPEEQEHPGIDWDDVIKQVKGD